MGVSTHILYLVLSILFPRYLVYMCFFLLLLLLSTSWLVFWSYFSCSVILVELNVFKTVIRNRYFNLKFRYFSRQICKIFLMPTYNIFKISFVGPALNFRPSGILWSARNCLNNKFEILQIRNFSTGGVNGVRNFKFVIYDFCVMFVMWSVLSSWLSFVVINLWNIPGLNLEACSYFKFSCSNFSVISTTRGLHPFSVAYLKKLSVSKQSNRLGVFIVWWRNTGGFRKALPFFL
jgi:hypothetical protein